MLLQSGSYCMVGTMCCSKREDMLRLDNTCEYPTSGFAAACIFITVPPWHNTKLDSKFLLIFFNITCKSLYTLRFSQTVTFRALCFASSVSFLLSLHCRSTSTLCSLSVECVPTDLGCVYSPSSRFLVCLAGRLASMEAPSAPSLPPRVQRTPPRDGRPPSRGVVHIIERVGRFHRVADYRAGAVVPVLERVVCALSVLDEDVKVPRTRVLSADRVYLSVGGIATVRVVDPRLAAYSVDDADATIKLVSAAALRAAAATFTSATLQTSPELLVEPARSRIHEALSQWGCQCTAISLGTIRISDGRKSSKSKQKQNNFIHNTNAPNNNSNSRFSARRQGSLLAQHLLDDNSRLADPTNPVSPSSTTPTLPNNTSTPTTTQRAAVETSDPATAGWLIPSPPRSHISPSNSMHEFLTPADVMAARTALARETAAAKRQRAIDNATVTPLQRAPSPGGSKPPPGNCPTIAAPGGKERKNSAMHRKHKKPSVSRDLPVEDATHQGRDTKRSSKERLNPELPRSETAKPPAKKVGSAEIHTLDSTCDVSFDLDALSNPPSVIILAQGAAVTHAPSPLKSKENTFEGNTRISDALLSEVVPEAASPKLIRSGGPNKSPTINVNAKVDKPSPPREFVAYRSAVSDESASVLEDDVGSQNTEDPSSSLAMEASDSGVSDDPIVFQVGPDPSKLKEEPKKEEPEAEDENESDHSLPSPPPDKQKNEDSVALQPKEEETSPAPPPSSIDQDVDRTTLPLLNKQEENGTTPGSSDEPDEITSSKPVIVNNNHPPQLPSTALVPLKKRIIENVTNQLPKTEPFADVVPQSLPVVVLEPEDTEETDPQRMYSFDETPPAPPPSPPRPTEAKETDPDVAILPPITLATKTSPATRISSSNVVENVVSEPTPSTGTTNAQPTDPPPVTFVRTPPAPPNTIEIHDRKVEVGSETSDEPAVDENNSEIVVSQPVLVELPESESVPEFVSAPDTTSPVTNSSDENEEPDVTTTLEEEEKVVEHDEEPVHGVDDSHSPSPTKTASEHEPEPEDTFEPSADMMPIPEEAPRFIPPRERKAHRARDIILDDDETQQPEVDAGEWDESAVPPADRASRRSREYLTRHQLRRQHHDEPMETVEPEPEPVPEAEPEVETREERRRRRQERRDRKARREEKRRQIAVYQEQMRLAAQAEAEAEAEYSDGWRDDEIAARRRERRARSASVEVPGVGSEEDSDTGLQRSSRWPAPYDEEYGVRERRENEKERERRRRDYERAQGVAESRERKRRGREPTPHSRERSDREGSRSRERSSSRYRDERERREREERRSRRRREAEADENLVRSSKTRGGSASSATTGRSRSKDREHWEAADSFVTDRSSRSRSRSANREVDGNGDRKRRSQSASELSRRGHREEEPNSKSRRVSDERDRTPSRSRARSRRRHRSDMAPTHRQDITLKNGSLLTPIYRHTDYEDSESDGANGKYIPWYCEGQSDMEEDAGEALRCLYISANGRTKCNHARCVYRRRRRRRLLKRGRHVTYHPKFEWTDSDFRVGRRY